MRIIHTTIILIIAVTSCNTKEPKAYNSLSKTKNYNSPIFIELNENEYKINTVRQFIHGEYQVLNLHDKTYPNFSSKGVVFVPALKCYIFGTEKSGENFINLVYASSNQSLKIKTDYSFANFIGEGKSGRQITTLESINGNRLVFKRTYTGSVPMTVSHYMVDLSNRKVSALQ